MAEAKSGGAHSAPKPMGFWTCWALTVGVMIGSGVFSLPGVLAPYGLVSFSGWVLTALGSVLLALAIGRLATRTTKAGGPYVYTRDAFGDLAGFVIGWGYWVSYWVSTPAIAIAFVGYLTVFFPALAGSSSGQALSALAIIWALILVSIRGTRDMGVVQLATTILKLIPLLAIIALGALAGIPDNLPAANPGGESLLSGLAATALLTMWAFVGFETGAVAAGNVANPERTIPRAVVIGTITVAVIYIASTAAVMLLVPADVLAVSPSPYAEAAKPFGTWGPYLIAAGALVSTAGSLNGVIFVTGQVPLAVALDKLAPAAFARQTTSGSPYVALLVGGVLSSLLLLANYTRGLIGTFAFLAMMATVTSLLPYLVSAAAELRHSWRSARGWAGLALLGVLYSIFAIAGSGLEVMAWGVALLGVGVPLFYLGRRKHTAPTATHPDISVAESDQIA